MKTRIKKVKQMKNISKVLCLVALVILGNQVNAQTKVVLDKVVAKLGSEVVLYSEVEEKIALMKQNRADIPDDARCYIIESLLASNLLVNQARIDSVLVTDVEVEAQMNARMDQILSMMNNDMNLFQEVYGQTVAQMKNQVKLDMEKKLLAERMQGQVMQGVDVTPSDVIAFFNRIPKDSLPYFASEVELGEIVHYPKVNKVEKQKALDKIQDIQNQLNEGGDFAELATKYSDDFGSGRQGGDLGFNSRGSFVPEFEAAAYKLKNGEVSDIVETQFGFHIIKLNERRGNSIHASHILVKPEITDADLEIARELLDSVRQLVIVDSMEFKVAVKKFSDEREQSYNNGGRMVNPKSGNTFFETADVDTEIFFAIDTIEVNDITSPIRFRSPQGEFVFRIVKLLSRSRPHKASLAEDYSKIQSAAKESRKNEIFNSWIEKTIGSTYIMVDPIYQGCPNVEKWFVPEKS